MTMTEATATLSVAYHMPRPVRGCRGNTVSPSVRTPMACATSRGTVPN